MAVILLLDEIMPTYSHYTEKELVYIIIIALSSRQPSSYAKCIKLNIRLLYDICLVSNTKCACLMRPYILRSLQLPYLICLRVSYDGYYWEARF